MRALVPLRVGLQTMPTSDEQWLCNDCELSYLCFSHQKVLTHLDHCILSIVHYVYELYTEYYLLLLAFACMEIS